MVGIFPSNQLLRFYPLKCANLGGINVAGIYFQGCVLNFENETSKCMENLGEKIQNASQSMTASLSFFLFFFDLLDMTHAYMASHMENIG